jgi:hypothetical protein
MEEVVRMARIRTFSAVMAALALVAGVPAAAGSAGALDRPPARGAHPAGSGPFATEGYVLQGVELAGSQGLCAGVRYEMVAAGRLLGCTHGPDPAPLGVNVLARQSLAAMRSRTAPTPAGVGTTPCIGNGTSGNRVQAIYAYQQGKPNHVSTVGPLIRTWAGEISATYDASAAETGGSRQIPFVTNAHCFLSVVAVALPASALRANFTATVNALHAKGFNKANRKYLVWADANVFCGIGQVFPDSSPGSSNDNNQQGSNPFSRGMTARIDNSCWGLGSTTGNPVEAHELTHTMGSVQSNAPRHSQNGHCTDEWDAMCYHDAPGTKLKFTCPVTHDQLLDCGHNDYFSTAPPAGSYLRTHWNSANNVFEADNLAPANDDWVHALPIAAGPGSYVGSTLRAAHEAAEPALPAVQKSASHSIWYRMKSPRAASLTVDTQGSSFDTVLGVYRGASVGSLTLVGSNDNAKAGKSSSRITVPTAANTTYWIRVDGKAGHRGEVVLHGGFGSVPTITSVSPQQARPGTTTITLHGTNLDTGPFNITVDGFEMDPTTLGFPDSGTMTFKVAPNTNDPDTVHYTAGMSGPVIFTNDAGIAISDASVKLTA